MRRAIEVNISLPKSVVLAVDDKPANLLALAAVLEDEHEVVFAQSGEEAIAAVQARHVDVILMDIQMPGMDGFQAASRIKTLEAAREIPIIFVTAVFNEDPYIRKGYEVGGVDYFAKPFDPEILRLKVGIYASFRQRTTVLKERERQVREAEELVRVGRKLSAALETLPFGVVIADVEGRICQITSEAARIFKRLESSPEDEYGELIRWWEGAGKAIKDDGGPLDRAIHNGETSHSEPVEIACFDGSRKTILVSASPLHGLDVRQVGAVVLIQDVTESKKIGAVLEERVTRFVSAGVELEESGTS